MSSILAHHLSEIDIKDKSKDTDNHINKDSDKCTDNHKLAGETVYSSKEKGGTLQAQSNTGKRKEQSEEELHFGVIFIADGSEAINVSEE